LLRTPICETLGIDVPVFLAGMGGLLAPRSARRSRRQVASVRSEIIRDVVAQAAEILRRLEPK
jgi:hypothetical protein